MERAAELAAIVASYLRRHGLSKTLAAFLDENGGAIAKEINGVDLETLYTNYTSTQPNGSSKKMKSKKGKHVEDDSPENIKVEDTTDDGKASASAKKKHGKKQDSAETAPDSEMVDGEGDKVELIDSNGKHESKKKSKREKKEKHTDVEELKVVAQSTDSVCETDFAGAENDSSKKKKKEKKSKRSESELTQNGSSEHPPNTPSQEDGSSKKKKKSNAEEDQSNVETDDEPAKKKRQKSKVSDGEDGKENNESSPTVDVATDKTQANGCESNSKKKKKKQKNESTDANGYAQEPLNSVQTENKDGSEKEEKPDSDDQAINSSSVDAAQLTPGSQGKKNKDTLGKNKTPTGALAFKRVDPEKVAFKDPRLQDNSYWAKDGAEEGYGAKAQEVLGLVRGRDFRHEKTKKKRGSYRGGQIGLESHSIKFQNSDDEE